MSKRKGVSAAEKRERLLSMFHDSGAVFTMKDVENGGSKVGIVSQAIKDVLKELTDDDLVHEGKVGVSTYYWSFPGEMGTKKRGQLASLRQEDTLLRAQIRELSAQNEELQKQRAAESGADDEGRAKEAEARVAALRAELEASKAELESLKSADAMDAHARKADVPILREAANRWTDNIFEIRKQLVRKFNMDPKELDKQLEITDLDYID